MENFKEFLTKRKLQLEVVKPNATPEEITKAWVALGYKPEDLEAKIRFKMMPDANEPHLNSMNAPIAPSVSSGSMKTNSLQDFQRKAAIRSTNAHIATDLKSDEIASQLHQAANARNAAQVAEKDFGMLGEEIPTSEVSQIPRNKIAYVSGGKPTEMVTYAREMGFPFYKYFNLDRKQFVVRRTPNA